MSVLRDAITEAMLAKADESPAIKSKMDEVAEAMAAVGRDLIGELPRMRHSGPTDVSELEVSGSMAVAAPTAITTAMVSSSCRSAMRWARPWSNCSRSDLTIVAPA